ncbi:MAG: hypothetical protein ACOZCP_09545 [Pseudomonadota bacterium]
MDVKGAQSLHLLSTTMKPDKFNSKPAAPRLDRAGTGAVRENAVSATIRHPQGSVLPLANADFMSGQEESQCGGASQ